MISAILLAAGESRRMGEPKQLMPFGKSTVLGQAVDNLLKSAVDEVVLVLGHRAEEVTRAIASKPVKIAVNPDYPQGISSSIIAGLGRVDRRAKAVMLALGDQPAVDSQTINSLVEAFIAHHRGIVIPVYRGMRGHPVIFAIGYKDELLELAGDAGGRVIIDRHPDDVLEVSVSNEGIFCDIDTMDDYRKAKKMGRLS